MRKKGLVALVGRPNVGKSTLFNRLVGQPLAVVSEIAGTTRDRLYADSDWNGVTFTVVDTGGIEVIEGWHTEPLSEDSDRFLDSIRMQAQVAIQDADVVVLVVDGRAGLTAADREVGNILRQTNKPVFVAANKLDDVVGKQHDALEFYELAIGEVVPLSALHGRGTGDLLDLVVAVLPDYDETWDEEDTSIKVALLGRPNTGKSTLFNKLIGEERVIVSPIAGTTRDAIDTKLAWHGRDFTLIDTAGIRRRGKIGQGIEKYSVIRALRALRRADVALLLIDASQGITAQDQHIAGMLKEESAAMVVLVNKWDAIEKDNYTMQEWTDTLRRELDFLPYVPVLFISAQHGQRLNKIFPEIERVYDARQRRITTGELNRFLREALTLHPPPSKSGNRLKFLYVTQASVAPPTFVFFVNDASAVHFSYQRFLENQLREKFDFTGTHIRMFFRNRKEEKDALE
ncbi:MAG: ribosome biogenesis GTPase Der [Chloroflexi bacterium]|nr:ribosome biogenesis GTPase Der [Chloroflexota bacterium]